MRCPDLSFTFWIACKADLLSYKIVAITDTVFTSFALVEQFEHLMIRAEYSQCQLLRATSVPVLDNKTLIYDK
jgi:hypothetical protein